MQAGLRVLLLCTGMAFSTFAPAQEAAAPVKTAIPFKTEPTPLESHGDNVGVAMLLLLAAAGGVLYYVRKKLPQSQLGLKFGNGKRIRILEQTRLNPRTTLYLVRVDQREILIGQCGETLSALDAAQLSQDGNTEVADV